jgi:hypothetical protein
VRVVRAGFFGAGWVLACCGGPQTITAPAPEYERPVVRPWDAGGREGPEDPFASAAEGEWIEEPADEVDAGAVGDGGTAAEDELATTADASADAAPDAVAPAGPAVPDASAVDAGGKP